MASLIYGTVPIVHGEKNLEKFRRVGQTSQLGTGVNLKTPQVHGLMQQWG